MRLPSDPKAHGTIVALLKRSGNYQVEVSQPLGQEMEYTLRMAQDVKPWPANQDISDKLVLGGSDYWAIEGKAGQIVRLAGLAEPFDLTLELYNPRGERIDANDDGDGGRNALLTDLLKETGRYLVRVSALRRRGQRRLPADRRPDPTRPLPIGGRIEGNLGTGSSDVWSFRGKAGQTVILSVRSQDFDPHATRLRPGCHRSRERRPQPRRQRTACSQFTCLWTASTRSGSRPVGAGGKYIIHLVDAD